MWLREARPMWSTCGVEVGEIYRYSRKEDKDRMGHGQRAPSDGALCLCAEHAGDCFFRYFILQQEADGTWRCGRRISAYVFGQFVTALPEKTMHGLLAGLRLKLPLKKILRTL